MGNGVPALLGLGAGEGEPAFAALGAGARVPGARRGAGLGAAALVALVRGVVGRARFEAVQASPAGVRVGAAVPPGEALELPLGAEQLGFQVDVRPAQSEGLALLEAYADTDDPAHEAGSLCRGFQEGFRFLSGEGVGLGLVHAGRVYERGDVLADDAAAVRDLQGAGQDAVHLHDVRGGVAGVEHGPVHPFQVLGLQLVDAVLADARDDVVARQELQRYYLAQGFTHVRTVREGAAVNGGPRVSGWLAQRVARPVQHGFTDCDATPVELPPTS